MKFTIVNRTRYQIRHLRAFVTRAYWVAWEAAPGRAQRHASTHARITITFARSNRRANGHSTGHAYLNSGRCYVGIHDQVNRRDFARVIAHEFGHCFGLDHADMTGGPLWGIGMSEEQNTRLYGWTDALPLDPQPAIPKPTAQDRYSYRRRLIEASLKRWQTKQKRAHNAIRKLTRQHQRLLRKAA